MSEWQPIETAPRGRNCLLFAVTERRPDGTVANWKMATGHRPYDVRNEEGWTWSGFRLREWERQPTHWMPLPAAPCDATSAPLNQTRRETYAAALDIVVAAIRKLLDRRANPSLFAEAVAEAREALQQIETLRASAGRVAMEGKR